MGQWSLHTASDTHTHTYTYYVSGIFLTEKKNHQYRDIALLLSKCLSLYNVHINIFHALYTNRK